MKSVEEKKKKITRNPMTLTFLDLLLFLLSCFLLVEYSCYLPRSLCILAWVLRVLARVWIQRKRVFCSLKKEEKKRKNKEKEKSASSTCPSPVDYSNAPVGLSIVTFSGLFVSCTFLPLCIITITIIVRLVCILIQGMYDNSGAHISSAQLPFYYFLFGFCFTLVCTCT